MCVAWGRGGGNCTVEWQGWETPHRCSVVRCPQGCLIRTWDDTLGKRHGRNVFCCNFPFLSGWWRSPVAPVACHSYDSPAGGHFRKHVPFDVQWRHLLGCYTGRGNSTEYTVLIFRRIPFFLKTKILNLTSNRRQTWEFKISACQQSFSVTRKPIYRSCQMRPHSLEWLCQEFRTMLPKLHLDFQQQNSYSSRSKVCQPENSRKKCFSTPRKLFTLTN